MKSHHWKRSTIIILVYFFVIFFACVYLTRSYLYITNEACFNLVHPYFFVPGWVFILNYKNVSHISSFSHSVISNFLRPHGLQHARLLCPSLTPGACSHSCPLSRWCIQPSHPLSSPFPSALNLSQHQGLFQWVGSLHQVAKVIRISVLPVNIQDWFPLGLTGLISLQSKGLSRVFSNTTVQKHQFFSAQPSSQSNSHIHTWPQEKP